MYLFVRLGGFQTLLCHWFVVCLYVGVTVLAITGCFQFDVLCVLHHGRLFSLSFLFSLVVSLLTLLFTSYACCFCGYVCLRCSSVTVNFLDGLFCCCLFRYLSVLFFFIFWCFLCPFCARPMGHLSLPFSRVSLRLVVSSFVNLLEFLPMCLYVLFAGGREVLSFYGDNLHPDDLFRYTHNVLLAILRM